jgi:Fur family ferric uptake transcriptional regulator
MQEFEEKLKANHMSMTVPRRAVFSLLDHADIPMSITEIAYELKTVDRSTIYRTVDLFEKLEIVKRVWFGLKSKVELSDQFQGHHHHLVCEKCGRITRLDHRELEKVINRLARKGGYKHTSHHVEVFGVCDQH